MLKKLRSLVPEANVCYFPLEEKYQAHVWGRPLSEFHDNRDSALREAIEKLQPQRKVSGTEYQVEIVWNREFHWVPYGDPQEGLGDAVRIAKDIEASGDGTRVKKSRVVDEEGEVAWQYGKKMRRKKK